MRVYKTLKKKIHKNIIHIITISLVSLIIIYCFFFNFRKNQISEYEIFNIIRKIQKISSDKNSLLILFEHQIAFDQVRYLFYHSIIFSEAFGQSLILNYESISLIKSKSEAEYFIFYDLPFIQNYTCQISFFLQNQQRISHKENIKKAIKTYKITFNLTNFNDILYSNENTSHLQCFGNSSLTRWCDMRYVAYIQTRLLFFTYAYYRFPSPFLSIGCRAPPFDIIEDRLYDEPMITRPDPSIKFSKIFNHITYIVGRFHNSMMMWHILFDFMIPLYWAITKIEGNFSTDSNRTILLRDSQYSILLEFIQTFSKNPIRNIKDDRRDLLFERAIVGLPKFEKNPTKYRRISEMATFKYNFNENISIGLRNVVLKGFGIEDKKINHENPSVIYVSRQNSNRDITNSDEVLNLMKSTCTFCNIKSVTFHQLRAKKQIEAVSDASVIIGLHGSGLTHTLWLPRSNKNFTSVLFEILPYKYWCRDWYQVAAKVAGVKYFSVMNTGRILPEIPDNIKLKYKFCSMKESHCNSIECNDILKDRKFQVELDTFNSTWLQIIDILKRNRENARK
ncbi:hypothetical protein M9Y10_028767 [Tritrichomonas musculus]|uniref:Glycosyltransferase 61 catalytic domain-containing protein n=1 Tax=Tritrichomonas musculus TaxID=1915356 RepID=A0ABR2KKA6_9EUKA